MRFIESFADDRHLLQCVHCAGETGTRDHSPPKVFLDLPYPDDLPVVPACRNCNNGFSLDEEYVASLVECTISGGVESAARPKIRKVLDRTPALTARLQAAKTVGQDGETSFRVEAARVERIVTKLARCHIAYEVAPHHEAPAHVTFDPIPRMTSVALQRFERPLAPSVWQEASSRALFRQAEAGGLIDWIFVQEGRYRYLAGEDTDTTVVRVVLSEYLACEVIWAD